ncbi:protease SohB [Halomonas elongata]|uniref:Protease SohB n=2 Tax=Halomonas elongata TaxID=2746 RepID=E1V393_HALED|nr:protease SohB [Halomonas elongata]OBX36301.1 putative protease SohB [Halomonas elongata]RAW07851.1 protease SohB [Halomonas elongata]WBF19868.1 protease SohB [Halomonas elongata]WPU48737.1 protease SohB [Halomonas elongata DSM 2581]CBV42572.1 probable protease SohB [Halomonas elongata DSM 2581]
MNEWLSELGMFLAQLLIVAVVVALALVMVVRARSGGGEERSQIRLEELNARRRRRSRRLRLASSEPSVRKRLAKSFRRDDKSRGKQGDAPRPTVWVLDFHGDLKASATGKLAEEVSAVLDAAEQGDEVVVRLESAGGLVHAYGHAAAEMDRLRQAGLSTTVCVDKVAASGGYLMACCADRLRAAPFAVLGSIGVVAQLPNVHRLLKRHDIDVEVLTAGHYKRTLTVFGENTEEGRQKFLAELDTVHDLFKRYVAERRPGLDIEAVATGEAWHGTEALPRGLIDEIGTSEAYLAERMNDARVIALSIQARRGLAERLGLSVSQGIERSVERGVEALDASLWQKR